MIDFMKSTAFKAGEIALKEADGIREADVEFKGEKDLVTAVDKKVEEFIRSEIAANFPGHVILGEEYGTTKGEGDNRWVIDPIDGTVSFVHALPGFSVSMAYQESGKTKAAVVYGPMLGQMFSAEEGKGTYLNGRRVHVSECSRLIDSVWATGFACLRAGLKENNLPLFTNIVPKLRDVRRMGSAALDLSYVAAGKLAGFWELSLEEYDVAAGILLVQEAGGQVCDFSGDSSYPEKGIVATNGLLTDEILGLLNQT